MPSAELVLDRVDLDDPAGDLGAELEELFEMTALERSTKTISSCTSNICYTTVVADLGMI
jgi:hypothetical protein